MGEVEGPIEMVARFVGRQSMQQLNVLSNEDKAVQNVQLAMRWSRYLVSTLERDSELRQRDTFERRVCAAFEYESSCRDVNAGATVSYELCPAGTKSSAAAAWLPRSAP